MSFEFKLHAHQIAAIQHVQENGLPVGEVRSLSHIFGNHPMWGGKTNMLQQRIMAMSEEDRAHFLSNTVVLCPSFDAPSPEGLAEKMRILEEHCASKVTCLTFAGDQRKTHVRGGLTAYVHSDTHVAVSGGGRSKPYPAAYYAPPKNAILCEEQPNTTDMFRMFRDNRNKPKRGKK